jgi:Recombinase
MACSYATRHGQHTGSAAAGSDPCQYARDAVTIIEHEAALIREIYARCLDGASPGEIARELTERGEVTGSGKPWQPYAVRSVLDSRHVTAIRVFRGEDAAEGDWPPIIDRGTWAEVQERRAYSASAHDRRGWRFYLLRGLVARPRLTPTGVSRSDQHVENLGLPPAVAVSSGCPHCRPRPGHQPACGPGRLPVRGDAGGIPPQVAQYGCCVHAAHQVRRAGKWHGESCGDAPAHEASLSLQDPRGIHLARRPPVTG